MAEARAMIFLFSHLARWAFVRRKIQGTGKLGNDAQQRVRALKKMRFFTAFAGPDATH
jgi:hypothetical protein